MNLHQFLSALRARWGIFVLLLAGTVAVATAVSLMLPKTYTATVSILVDAKEEQSLNNALRPLMLPQEKASYLQTQLDIITSEKVARKVVQSLRLAQAPVAREAADEASGGGGSVEDKLVESLLDGMKIDTSQSSVMRVSYSSRDPQLAADIANAFAKAYIDTMLELRVEPTQKAAAWFDEQLKTLRAHLEDAQAKLTDYHQKHGIVSPDERSDVESTRLTMLSDQVSRAQEQSLDWESREQQARAFARKGVSLDRIPDALNSPFIQKLKEDLLHGEAKLQEIGTNYGVNYPAYQRQAAENEAMKARLEVELKKVLAGIESSAQQSRNREAESRRALSEQRTRVLALKESRNELTVLRRNVESAERAYDTAMQRSVVSQVDSRINQTSVMVLNPATAPRKPSRPKVLLNVVLSVIVGTILGTVMVTLLELLDRRVRTRSDLELEVPLLAVLNRREPVAAGRIGWSGRTRPRLPSPG